MFFSHSPKGCEKRKHGKRCAALPHEISPAHSARVKHSLFSVGFTSFSVSVPCVWRLVQRMEQLELTITPHLSGKENTHAKGRSDRDVGAKL